MSEEEKKAIKELTEIKELVEDDLKFEDYGVTATLDQIDLRSLVIALNIIKKQQEQLQEKDKIIDTIIDEYEYNARINVKDFCEETMRKDRCIQDCKGCIIEYFTKKAREV